MALIYIDTNVYLDFYQAATDRLSIFKEIEKYAGSLVLPKQTVDEFLRNRVARLATLVKEVNKSVSTSIYTTAIIRETAEFAQIDQHQKEIKNLAANIKATLNAWKDDKDADPVLVEFDKLVGKANFIVPSVDAILRAKDRKLLGNPPTSPDKYTIGDELIWETLLEAVKEDLIIVSRDHTFTENVSLLKEEYLRVTAHKLLLITKDLSEALQVIGEDSPRLKAAEKEVAESVDIDARTLGDKCPKCGGQLEENGYEGSEGDSAWWLDCTKCGATFFPNRYISASS